MDDHEYDYIEEVGLYVCIDCGATGTEPSLVKHFESCTPGESNHLEEQYNEFDDLT